MAALARTACLLAAFTLTASAARAYILPSGFLLNKYYKKRPSKLKSYKVELQTSLVGGQYEGGEVSGKEVWYVALPMKFRSELELPGGTRIVVVSKGRRYTIEPGQKGEAKMEPAMFDPVINLLARGPVKGKKKSFRAGDLLLSDLETAGIDVKVRGLTRMGDHIAVIIGAKEGEEDKPQLWIDKDTFLPLRYLSGKEAGGIDVRFSDFITMERRRWLPGKIEFYRDNKLFKMQEVKDVDLKWKPDMSLFAPPKPANKDARQ